MHGGCKVRVKGAKFRGIFAGVENGAMVAVPEKLADAVEGITELIKGGHGDLARVTDPVLPGWAKKLFLGHAEDGGSQGEDGNGGGFGLRYSEFRVRRKGEIKGGRRVIVERVHGEKKPGRPWWTTGPGVRVLGGFLAAGAEAGLGGPKEEFEILRGEVAPVLGLEFVAGDGVEVCVAVFDSWHVEFFDGPG